MGSRGAFYDMMWERFTKLQALNPAARHRHRLIEQRVARRFGNGSGRVLDVGCGPGQLLERLAQRFPKAELCGSDVSEKSLQIAQRHGTACELFQLDLLADDFTGWKHLGHYDVVICSEVLEHLSDDLRAIQRLRWLMGDDGHLIITVPGGTRSRFDERIGHQRHYTRRTLATLLVEAHLTPLEITAWGFPFHNAYRTAVRTASHFALPPEPAPDPQPESEPRPNTDPLAETGPQSNAGPAALSPTLQMLYAITARALDPLYHLNAPFWGEQLIAVARL